MEDGRSFTRRRFTNGGTWLMVLSSWFMASADRNPGPAHLPPFQLLIGSNVEMFICLTNRSSSLNTLPKRLFIINPLQGLVRKCFGIPLQNTPILRKTMEKVWSRLNQEPEKNPGKGKKATPAFPLFASLRETTSTPLA